MGTSGAGSVSKRTLSGRSGNAWNARSVSDANRRSGRRKRTKTRRANPKTTTRQTMMTKTRTRAQ
jgi:hypothetical protein